MKLPRTFGWIICLTAAVYLTGCTNQPSGDVGDVTPAAEEKHDHDHDHDHAHAHGPHDGHVIELGDEEYHAEITLDEESKKLTIYVYGPELKNAVPIDQKEVIANLKIDGKDSELKLAAAPQEGDGEGKSSRFELTLSEDVAKGIHDAEDLIGTIKLKIEGVDFEGEITHDHDHDHGHEHKDDHDHDDEDHDHKDGEDHDHKDEK